MYRATMNPVSLEKSRLRRFFHTQPSLPAAKSVVFAACRKA
jgi:hypothetical protein